LAEVLTLEYLLVTYGIVVSFFDAADYVYFETSSTTPYQIRRIEELYKVGVVCMHVTFTIAVYGIATVKIFTDVEVCSLVVTVIGSAGIALPRST